MPDSTFKHFLFSSAITAPFVLGHQSGGPLSAADLTDGDPVVEPDLVTELCSRSHELVYLMVSSNEELLASSGIVSTALFLVLSFRVNRAIGRWAEGRKRFGELIADVRALALGAQSYFVPEQRRAAVDVGLLSFAFARSCELHLRCEGDAKVAATLGPVLRELDPDHHPAGLNALLAAPNRPGHLIDLLVRLHGDSHNLGHMHGIRSLVAQHATLERQLQRLEALQRIQCTPEPFAFQKHLRFTTLLWLGLLPVALAPSLFWAAPLLSTTIGFVVFKLEDVAVEVQNPFGW